MKKNLPRKKLLLAALLIVVVIAGFCFYKNYQQKQNLTLYGNVDIKEVSVSFRVPGRLKKLYFDEGDYVKKGDLLAELDDDTFINQLELSQANLEAVAAVVENINKKFQRRKKLYQDSLSSKQEYEDEKYSLKQIQAQYDAAQANLQIAQTAFDDTKLLAPSDGYVMVRAFEIGSMLLQNQTVYELSLTNQAYVRAYVDEKDLGKIVNGMNVEIITDSGSTYRGQIGFISAKAEFTPKSVETTSLRTQLVYRIRITVLNSDDKLKQGMPVTLLIKN